MPWDPERPTLTQRCLLLVAPLLAALLLRGLAWSWRIRRIDVEDRVPTRRSTACSYAIWHGSVLPLGGIFAGEPVHSVISQSFDGELITRAAVHLGQARTLRGSSSRGGANALKEMTEALSAGGFVLITVDGPRGPRHQAKDGVIKAAQLSATEIIPVGFAASSAMRFRSWDQGILPAPFSRVSVVFGPALKVKAGEAGLSQALTELQASLEAATSQAEAALLNGGGIL